MKYLSLIICAFVSFQLSAQNAVEDYFSNHLDNQEATVVQVSGKLFQYAAKFIPDDELEDMPVEDAKDMLSNITSFVLVKIDSLNNSKAEYRSGIRKLEGSGSYEELIRVSDKENNFSLFIDESNDVIHEIVGVVSTEDEFVVAALTGEMRLDQIQNIIAKIESTEIKSVMRGVDVNVSDMKVYPNPTTSDNELMVEVPEKMIGGTINIYDMSGSKVMSITAEDRQHTISTDNMSSGQYVVEINKAGVTLKKKLVVTQ